MVMKRLVSAIMLSLFGVFAAGFLSIQGIAVVGEALFSPFGILFLIAVVFGELTAVSL